MISIILPIYNVENYIAECLESLRKQTIGEEHLEVILIDDCSTDNTANEIMKFKNKFTNFIYYKYKKNNGSPGKPRNKGVELATGDYIHFMDPDDILVENAYEMLLENIRDNDDFVMGKMMSFNEDGSTFQHSTFKEHKLNKTYASVALEQVPFFAQVKVGVVLKLIRTQFYKQNNIQFTENMTNGEDKLVDAVLYTKAAAFSYIPEVIYLYRNRISDVNKSLTHLDLEKSIANDIEAYYICKECFTPEELQFFKINVLRSLFWKIISSEFANCNAAYQIKVIKQVGEITKGMNKQLYSHYFEQQEPIINLINNKEYELSVEYIKLLNNRRNTYYQGKFLFDKNNESKKFYKSKSYKLYQMLHKITRENKTV